MIVNYEAAKDIKTLDDLSESFYQISLLIDDIFMACCNNNIDISKYEQDMRESYYLAKYGGSCSKELVSGTGHITWSKKDV